MATLRLFDCFVEDVAHGVHNLRLDTLKVLLTNREPRALDRVRADVAEIQAENGYPNGGMTVETMSSGQEDGVYRLVLADVKFAAEGGPFGPFQFIVLYNSTPTQPLQPLIGWDVYPGEVTLNDGEAFPVEFDRAPGAVQIA